MSYQCNKCNYNTKLKYNYTRHLSSEQHKLKEGIEKPTVKIRLISGFSDSFLGVQKLTVLDCPVYLFPVQKLTDCTV